MNDLIQFQMNSILKTSEFFVGMVQRGSEALLRDLKVMSLKNEAATALITFFNRASAEVRMRERDEDSAKKEINIALDDFKACARAVFGKFEVDKSYDVRSGWERLIQYAARKTFHNIPYVNAEIKGLQKDCEHFWIKFFELVRRADSEADEKAIADLLDNFESNIRDTLYV